MCGIVGALPIHGNTTVKELDLRRMLAAIRHRGPDGFGLYQDEKVGLGSARLSIIDLNEGYQPISNEDGNLWIVFNGEIFDYLEHRDWLEKRGHRFSTHTDTEVILHLYEEMGPKCLEKMNGQFALAIWDTRAQSLFLARDRVGIRPLFYTIQKGTLVFASEIKSILAYPGVQAEINPTSLDQIFTYWACPTPGTVFNGIYEIPPGHSLMVKNGKVTTSRYWKLDFTKRKSLGNREENYLEALEFLLLDSILLRLRADVPVGAYLSGGLDSSLITALVRKFATNRLDTFSIVFEDPDFDESVHQQRMASFLGTDHHIIYAQYADIGRAFPQVIWHAETPILRTAPAPMYLLSGLVHDLGYKVVLTGEGADEFLAGYDIFKELAIRRFWARQPNSTLRPMLFKRIYPDITALPQQSAYLGSFFGLGLSNVDDPDYSHAIRWRNTSRIKRFFSDELRAEIATLTPARNVANHYPRNFAKWHPLERAQYLEIKTFLSQYLLSSQGDRMGMAHSVEGRYPFLDYRLMEFTTQLPPELKLSGLTEKFLLKKLGRKWLPAETWQRTKRPYRAPIHRSFFNERQESYVGELLSPESLLRSGLFNPQAVSRLVAKVREGKRLGETDDMALCGILSTLLVQQLFIHDYCPPSPVADAEIRKSCTKHIIHRP